jgi:NADH-quinone oxidoreductase subunit J
MSAYLFYILAFLSVFSALMVVVSRKPVHSILYLVFCFFTIAGHFILLNAQFVAAVHVIVYSGAIMVLFLFVIMLLNLNADIEPTKSTFLKAASVITGGVLMVLLIASLKDASYMPSVDGAVEIGMVENIGKVLYNEYLLPFEVSALLFLSAMIGATMIGKKES